MRAPAIAFACLAWFACDKGESPKGSGALPAAELALFEHLPAGGNIVFGGNFMKVQAWMNSTFGQSMDAIGPGWKDYAQCWTEMPRHKLAGTASFTGGAGQMQMVFSGASLEDLKKCADRGGFKTNIDPDGKYLALQVTTLGKTVDQGFLQLPDGSLYSRHSLGIGGTPVPGTRADLEADIAKLGQATALDDARLKKLVAKVDRTKTMWFAGTAAGTSIGDKLGEVYGAVDIVPGMTLDITVELLDAALADKVMSGVKDVKQNVGELPAEMRSIIENLVVTRDGRRIRAIAKMTDDQLATFMKQVGALAGAGAL